MLREGWNFHNDIAIDLEKKARSVFDYKDRIVNTIFDADAIESEGRFAEAMIIVIRTRSRMACFNDEINAFVYDCGRYIGLKASEMENEITDDLYRRFKELWKKESGFEIHMKTDKAPFANLFTSRKEHSLNTALDSKLRSHIDLLIHRYPKLEDIALSIISAYKVMEEAYNTDHKLLIAGNGGSAADAEHIAGELMKRFKTPRPVTSDFACRLCEIDNVRGPQLARNLERGLMAIPLVAHEALSTAYINDVDGYGVFAQQLLGFGRTGDVFLGISTSGNSANIMNAVVVAKALGIKVIGLTGVDGGELAKAADVAVKVPESETYMIQEFHLPIYHCWCLMLEDRFFGKGCN